MELYFKSILMYLKSDMEYKSSFILTFIGYIFSTSLAILSTVFLLEKFGPICRMDT